MSPLIALEPLRDAVYALAGAIVLLSLALQVERAVAAFQERRAGRKEARLTKLVYRVIQGELCIAEVAALSRLERRVARGILLRLAPDLRGERHVDVGQAGLGGDQVDAGDRRRDDRIGGSLGGGELDGAGRPQAD